MEKPRARPDVPFCADCHPVGPSKRTVHCPGASTPPDGTDCVASVVPASKLHPHSTVRGADVPDAVPTGDAVAEDDTDGVVDGDPVRDRVRGSVGVCDGDAPALRLDVALEVADVTSDGDGVAVTEAVGRAVAEGVLVGDGVAGAYVHTTPNVPPREAFTDRPTSTYTTRVASAVTLARDAAGLLVHVVSSSAAGKMW